MLALQTVCCHNFSFYFFIPVVRNALLEWALTCNTKNLCNDWCESTCSLTNVLQKEFKKTGHLFREWIEWLKHSKNIHEVANLLVQSPVFSLCISYSLTKHNIISKFHYCIIMLVHMKQGFFKFSPYITSRKFMFVMFLFAFFLQEVSAQAKMILFAFRRLALCCKAYP